MIAKLKARRRLKRAGPDFVWDDSKVYPHDVPSRPKDGLFLEAEIVQPPSSAGRSITVWVPPEMLDGLLVTLREHAIERRR